MDCTHCILLAPNGTTCLAVSPRLQPVVEAARDMPGVICAAKTTIGDLDIVSEAAAVVAATEGRGTWRTRDRSLAACAESPQPLDQSITRPVTSGGCARRAAARRRWTPMAPSGSRLTPRHPTKCVEWQHGLLLSTLVALTTILAVALVTVAADVLR